MPECFIVACESNELLLSAICDCVNAFGCADCGFCGCGSVGFCGVTFGTICCELPGLFCISKHKLCKLILVWEVIKKYNNFARKKCKISL